MFDLLHNAISNQGNKISNQGTKNIKHGIWKIALADQNFKTYYQYKTLNLSDLDIYVGPNKFFKAKMNDFTLHYRMTKTEFDLDHQDTSEWRIFRRWMQGDKMTFWQNQLNFAIYCATTACGVSKEHLTTGTPLQKAIMYFHIYYMVRRILFQLEARLPTDDGFDDRDCTYNKKAYEAICNELGIKQTPFITYTEDSDYDGLGSYYTNTGGSSSSADYYKHYIWQKPDIKGRWSILIADESKGFTKPGAVRINESIRNYVYCLLGAQVQTRSPIVGDSTGGVLDAQKQFVYLLEKSIAQPFSLEDSIANYQKACESASSLIDYNLGVGLYMVPSDMNLAKLSKVYKNFNDMIVVGKDKMPLGKQPQPDPVIKKTTPRVTNTGDLTPPKPTVVPPGVTIPVLNNADIQTPVTPVIQHSDDTLSDHNTQKLVLTVGIISSFTLVYWIYKG